MIYGFSSGCLTDGISSSGSILDFVPLNKTAFERLVSLLPWLQTWIGVNNIEPLTPEGWFEEGHRMKGEKKIKISYGCLITLRALFIGTYPLSGRLDVEAIRGDCAQTAHQISFFYLS